MERQKVLIILSIVILFLMWNYNIYRYLKLHYDSDSEYINNYKYLKKCVDCRVVISLTTTPDRIKFIKPVIKSLLDQTVKVDQIGLNIPNNDLYKIPKSLKEMCNIFKCGRDYGPGTKFIPTILRETSANTIIIMLDDDYIYDKNFIKKILKEFKLKNCALYSDEAMVLKPEFIDTNILYTNKQYIDNNWIKNYIKVNQENIDDLSKDNLRSFRI